jgi:hypothetical protein
MTTCSNDSSDVVSRPECGCPLAASQQKNQASSWSRNALLGLGHLLPHCRWGRAPDLASDGLAGANLTRKSACPTAVRKHQSFLFGLSNDWSNKKLVIGDYFAILSSSRSTWNAIEYCIEYNCQRVSVLKRGNSTEVEKLMYNFRKN